MGTEPSWPLMRGPCLALLCSAALWSCGGSPVRPPTAPPGPSTLVRGRVTDRLTDSSIDGSTITFAGVTTYAAAVAAGQFALELPSGQYSVSVDGPSHVRHSTQIVFVEGGADLTFTVLRWGPTSFGAAYDDTFHKAFHQMARISPQGDVGIHRWALPPSEIYLVEGTIPDEQFAMVRDLLNELQDELPKMWCGFAGPRIPLKIGPQVEEVDGRIVVIPNWDEGAGGTVRWPTTRSGRVRVNVFGTTTNSLLTSDVVRNTLLHEFHHVAFGYHLCGGDLGSNPFGFSQENCPYVDSVMANRPPLKSTYSPQDRLAACIVYDSGTHVGNRFPDIHARYQ